MDAGINPGILCMCSSKKYSTDFIEKHINESRGSKGVWVSTFSQWEAKPRAWSGKSFKVMVGDRHTQTRVLQPFERIDESLFKIIEVPEEYKEDFLRYPDESLRDIAGIMTYAVGTLIPRRDKIIAPCAKTTR